MEPFRGGGAASHVGGNVGEWRATTADLAITTKKLVIFRRREFSTPPPPSSDSNGGEDDHSFSFSTHATEWAWNYGRAERAAAAAAFITLMSGRYLSSHRPNESSAAPP